MSDTPPRRDVTLTPKPEDRRPCPQCHEPGDSVVYKGAVISAFDKDARDGILTVSMQITSVLAAQWQPCGHEFDGATGVLIKKDGG